MKLYSQRKYDAAISAWADVGIFKASIQKWPDQRVVGEWHIRNLPGGKPAGSKVLLSPEQAISLVKPVAVVQALRPAMDTMLDDAIAARSAYAGPTQTCAMVASPS